MGTSEKIYEQKDYEYLIKIFKKEVIEDRRNYLEKRVYKFIEKMGFEDCVMVNQVLVDMTVIDYFADIARIKGFQEIERVNKNKITAYTAYWWLRRKPIQVIVTPEVYDDELTFVNEKFVTSLLLKDFFDAEIQDIENSKEYKGYMELLFYYMKYRPLSPQALELMLATADVGKMLGEKKS